MDTPEKTEGKLPGLILAAGNSSRMGHCKLILPVRGKPLVEHALCAARGGGLEPILLIVGPQSSQEILKLGRKWAVAKQLGICTADLANLGQAESLKAGLRAMLEICPHTPGIMVLLGDQPLINPALVEALTRRFFELESRGAQMCVAPAFLGQRGNPVILHRAVFPDVLNLQGDAGARSLLAGPGLDLLSCQDDACLMDIDTPQAYKRLSKRL